MGNLFGQYGPLYGDLRGYDSIPNYRAAIKAFDAKRYDDAQAILDTASSLFLEKRDFRKVYTVQNEKGVMYFLEKSFQKSFDILTANLTLMQENNDTLHHEFAMNMRFMGYLANQWGLVQQPRRFYYHRQRTVLEMMKDSTQIMADCYGDLGIDYTKAGNMDEGLDYLLKARRLHKKTKNDYSLLVIDHTITNRMEVEQPQVALQVFESQYRTAARKYYRDSVALFILSYTIATKNNNLENYQKAIHYLKEAKYIFNTIKYPYADMQVALPLDLAENFALLSDYENFKAHTDTAILKYNSNHQNLNMLESLVYGKIGMNYIRFNPDSAITYLNHGLEILSGGKETDADLQLKIQNAMAEAYAEKGEWQLANNQMLRTMAAATQNDSTPLFSCHSEHPETLLDVYKSATRIFANAYKKSTDHQFLTKTIEAACCADTLFREFARKVADERTLLNWAKEYKQISSLVLNTLHVSNQPYPEIVFEFLAKSKAFQLVNDINRNQYAQSASTNDSIWTRKTELETNIRQLNNEMTTARISASKEQTDSLDIEIRNLLIESLVVNYKLIRGQENPVFLPDETALLASLQSKMQDSQALLDYFFAGEEVYALSITSNSASFARISDAEPLLSAQKLFLRAVKTGGDYAASSKILSDILLKPFATQLSTASSVTFIPDNVLFQIPFELLPNPLVNKLMVETHSVGYNYSSALYTKTLETKKPAELKVFAIAPVYKKEETAMIADNFRSTFDADDISELFKQGKLDALPYTETEVKSIGKLLNSKDLEFKILVGNEASKENMMKDIDNYNIIHIASHGYASKKNPEFSGLFLSQNQAQAGSENGYIHVGEVAAMKRPCRQPIFRHTSA